jgi:hypothetical protein
MNEALNRGLRGWPLISAFSISAFQHLLLRHQYSTVCRAEIIPVHQRKSLFRLDIPRYDGLFGLARSLRLKYGTVKPEFQFFNRWQNPPVAKFYQEQFLDRMTESSLVEGRTSEVAGRNCQRPSLVHRPPNAATPAW